MKLASIFETVLNMSLTGSIVILVVCLARLLLKRAPKIYSYALWALVLFRLLCPVAISSGVSLIPEDVGTGAALREWEDGYVEDTVIVFDNQPQFQTAVDAGRKPIDAGENGQYVVTAPDKVSAPATVESRVLPVLAVVWLVGLAVMGLYGAVSSLKIRRQTRVSVPVGKNVYLGDDVRSPFVMGIFRPKIYLPGTLAESEREFILCHEQHHIRRGDPIFKALGFLALAIHWFNPLVWLAFSLASRDMEMSCDEAVIRKLGQNVRAEYSAALLNLATGRRIVSVTPLAFGEGDPKGRIRNLANWKKPAFWVAVVCVILCVVLGVCLLTNPSEETTYYLTIAEDGVKSIQYSFKNQSGTVGHEDGTAFAIGERVQFLELDALNDLSGVTITGFGTNGERVFTLSAPEKPHHQPIRALCSGDWMFAPEGYDLSPEETVYSIAFSELDTSAITEVYLRNLHNGVITYVTDPEDVSAICEYIKGISGTNGGSSKGYYEGTYGVKLLHNYEETFSLSFGDSSTFAHGKGTDGYSIRYELADRDISDVTAFFCRFDSSVPKSLEELPADYSADQAAADGCLVSRDGTATDNKDRFLAFAEKTGRGAPDTIRVMNWTDQTAAIYDLTFDGTQYTVSWLEDGQRQEKTYRYLRHFTGDKEWENMAYNGYEHYVLVNDEAVTWEQIFNGLISSHYGDAIDHWTVYSEYGS